MPSYPEEVIEFARELYFTPAEDGTHKFSYQQISNAIKDTFPSLKTFPNKTTVYRWSNKKDKDTGRSWKSLWNEALVKGALEARKDFDKSKGEEEKIQEKIMLFHRRLALIAMDYIMKGYLPVKGKNYVPETVKEGNQLVTLGLNILKMQTDQVKEMDDKIVNIVISKDDSIDTRTSAEVLKERERLKKEISV